MRWSLKRKVRKCYDSTRKHRTCRALATVRSKWLRCGHCALEMVALYQLCTRNGCAVAIVCSKWLPQGATVRSNWPCCGHCALETNGCAVATVRSKWLRCGHCALEVAALWPLCAQKGCVNSTFSGRIHFVRLPRHRKVPYVNLVLCIYTYIYIIYIYTY